jgi:hypothetical protein
MRLDTEPAVGIERGQIEDTVLQLFDEAKAAMEERMVDNRTPFFGPVSIAIEEDGQQWQFSGFSREVSPSGIGLLHNMPLDSGDVVVVTIPRRMVPDTRFQCKLRWCEPCGEGWYISGAEFRAVLPAE